MASNEIAQLKLSTFGAAEVAATALLFLDSILFYAVDENGNIQPNKNQNGPVTIIQLSRVQADCIKCTQKILPNREVSDGIQISGNAFSPDIVMYFQTHAIRDAWLEVIVGAQKEAEASRSRLPDKFEKLLFEVSQWVPRGRLLSNSHLAKESLDRWASSLGPYHVHRRNHLATFMLASRLLQYYASDQGAYIEWFVHVPPSLDQIKTETVAQESLRGELAYAERLVFADLIDAWNDTEPHISKAKPYLQDNLLLKEIEHARLQVSNINFFNKYRSEYYDSEPHFLPQLKAWQEILHKLGAPDSDEPKETKKVSKSRKEKKEGLGDLPEDETVHPASPSKSDQKKEAKGKEAPVSPRKEAPSSPRRELKRSSTHQAQKNDEGADEKEKSKLEKKDDKKEKKDGKKVSKDDSTTASPPSSPRKELKRANTVQATLSEAADVPYTSFKSPKSASPKSPLRAQGSGASTEFAAMLTALGKSKGSMPEIQSVRGTADTRERKRELQFDDDEVDGKETSVEADVLTRTAVSPRAKKKIVVASSGSPSSSERKEKKDREPAKSKDSEKEKDKKDKLSTHEKKEKDEEKKRKTQNALDALDHLTEEDTSETTSKETEADKAKQKEKEERQKQKEKEKKKEEKVKEQNLESAKQKEKSEKERVHHEVELKIAAEIEQRQLQAEVETARRAKEEKERKEKEDRERKEKEARLKEEEEKKLREKVELVKKEKEEKERKEKEEREKKEKEERRKKEKEEKERKEKEEKEKKELELKLLKEKEEKERSEKEEQERKEKEKKEKEEKRKKEKEEKEKKELELKLLKEKEEKELLEKEEQERKEKEKKERDERRKKEKEEKEKKELELKLLKEKEEKERLEKEEQEQKEKEKKERDERRKKEKEEKEKKEKDEKEKKEKEEKERKEKEEKEKKEKEEKEKKEKEEKEKKEKEDKEIKEKEDKEREEKEKEKKALEAKLLLEKEEKEKKEKEERERKDKEEKQKKEREKKEKEEREKKEKEKKDKEEKEKKEKEEKEKKEREEKEKKEIEEKEKKALEAKLLLEKVEKEKKEKEEKERKEKEEREKKEKEKKEKEEREKKEKEKKEKEDKEKKEKEEKEKKDKEERERKEKEKKEEKERREREEKERLEHEDREKKEKEKKERDEAEKKEKARKEKEEKEREKEKKRLSEEDRHHSQLSLKSSSGSSEDLKVIRRDSKEKEKEKSSPLFKKKDSRAKRSTVMVDGPLRFDEDSEGSKTEEKGGKVTPPSTPLSSKKKEKEHKSKESPKYITDSFARRKANQPKRADLASLFPDAMKNEKKDSEKKEKEVEKKEKKEDEKHANPEAPPISKSTSTALPTSSSANPSTPPTSAVSVTSLAPPPPIPNLTLSPDFSMRNVLTILQPKPIAPSAPPAVKDIEQLKKQLPSATKFGNCFRDILAARGNALAACGKRDKAIAIFEQLVRAEENNVEALKSLGTLYLLEDEIDDAIEILQRAVQLRPHDASVLNNLAVALLYQGHVDVAYSALQDALKHKATSPDVYNNLGVIHQLRSEYDVAKFYFEKALKVKPTLKEALNNRGTVYGAEGLFATAADCFDKAFLQDEEYLKALSNKEMARTFMLNSPVVALPPFDPRSSTAPLVDEKLFGAEELPNFDGFPSPISEAELKEKVIPSLRHVHDVKNRLSVLGILLKATQPCLQVFVENGGLKTLNKWVQHAYMKQQFDIVETAAVALARVKVTPAALKESNLGITFAKIGAAKAGQVSVFADRLVQKWKEALKGPSSTSTSSSTSSLSTSGGTPAPKLGSLVSKPSSLFHSSSSIGSGFLSTSSSILVTSSNPFDAPNPFPKVVESAPNPFEAPKTPELTQSGHIAVSHNPFDVRVDSLASSTLEEKAGVHVPSSPFSAPPMKPFEIPSASRNPFELPSEGANGAIAVLSHPLNPFDANPHLHHRHAASNPFHQASPLAAIQEGTEPALPPVKITNPFEAAAPKPPTPNPFEASSQFQVSSPFEVASKPFYSAGTSSSKTSEVSTDSTRTNPLPGFNSTSTDSNLLTSTTSGISGPSAATNPFESAMAGAAHPLSSSATVTKSAPLNPFDLFAASPPTSTSFHSAPHPPTTDPFAAHFAVAAPSTPESLPKHGSSSSMGLVDSNSTVPVANVSKATPDLVATSPGNAVAPPPSSTPTPAAVSSPIFLPLEQKLQVIEQGIAALESKIKLGDGDGSSISKEARVLEEELTQLVLKMDGVSVQGNDELRLERKRLVARVHANQDRLDELFTAIKAPSNANSNHTPTPPSAVSNPFAALAPASASPSNPFGVNPFDLPPQLNFFS